MQVSWLHVSDFHIRGGDPHDRCLVVESGARPFQARPHCANIERSNGAV